MYALVYICKDSSTQNLKPLSGRVQISTRISILIDQASNSYKFRKIQFISKLNNILRQEEPHVLFTVYTVLYIVYVMQQNLPAK